jgi:glycosyltransferase involved in cell wall biosynthesis
VRLDIVMPAHNEEDRIDRTLRAYRAACPDDGVRFLVALDSCTDHTPEIVAAHARDDDRVLSFDYPKIGKGGVIAETFARADAELIAFVDADGATPPRELLRLADAARHVDGAIASRRHPAALLPARRPLAREITSAGFAGSVRMLMGLPYRDTQCGAKVLRRHVVRDVLPRLAARDLLFDVDLLAAAGERGWHIVEVPTVWIDQAGSRVNTVADSRRMGTSLVRLWLRRRLRPAGRVHAGA